MKLLVIDGDREFLQSFGRLCKSNGVSQVKLAIGGVGALQVIMAAPDNFNGIFVGTPKGSMDAILTCRTLRMLRGYSLVPIFMMSTDPDAETIDAAFAAGANDVLSRDFVIENTTEAVSLVRAALDARAGTSAVGSLTGSLDVDVTENSVGFHEKIEIEAVERFVDRVTFDNYIRNLSKSEKFDTRIFAIRVEGLKEIFEQRSHSQFRHLLTVVAAEIVRSFPASRRLFSYSGGGLFICAFHGATEIDRRVLADTIRTALAELVLEIGADLPQDLAVRISRARKALGVFRCEANPDEAVKTAASQEEAEPERLSVAEFLARRGRVYSTMLEHPD